LLEDFQSRFGKDVIRILLIGSKARGDDSVESDIDLVVVAKQEDWELKHKVLIRGARLSLEHEVLFNLYVISQDRWNWMGQIRHPFFRTTTTEGLDLSSELAIS